VLRYVPKRNRDIINNVDVCVPKNIDVFDIHSDVRETLPRQPLVLQLQHQVPRPTVQ
jgi:hypothetical protein